MIYKKRKHIVESVFKAFSNEPVFSYIEKSLPKDEFYVNIEDDEITNSHLLYLPHTKINTFNDKKTAYIKWDYFVFIRFCYLWKEVISEDDKKFLNKLVQCPGKFLIVRKLLPFMSMQEAINVTLFEFMESYFYFGEGREHILRRGMDNLVVATTPQINRIVFGLLPVFAFIFLLAAKALFYPAEFVVSGSVIHFVLSYGLGLACGDLFVIWRYIDSSLLVNEMKGKNRYTIKYLLPFYRFWEELKFLARGLLIFRENKILSTPPGEISPFILRAKEFCASFLTFEDYLLADATVVSENKLVSLKRVKV